MPIKNRLAEMHDEITGWRRHLHAHPELDFDVHETAAFVADKLAEFGVDEITTGVGRTGVVAVIHGRERSSGRGIGLRADMDALPITEATGAAHASVHPGKMHACGHDGHTAMLLGAAKYLAETRNFNGTAVLIFQPAEEFSGGGREMVEDGLMRRWQIDEVYGMHTAPGLPVGVFATRPGPLLAAADQFEILIEGVGGHAAAPHEAVDPNLAAAHVVVALQAVASRAVDPLKQVVVSICTMRADTEAFNVIPQTVLMRGTTRTLEDPVRQLAEDRIRRIVTATAQAHGCSARIDYQRGYPVTVNDAAMAEIAADIADAVSGQVIRDIPPIMAGEDFSYMLRERPGAYLMIGNGESAQVHHPGYDFDDAAIPFGCSLFAELVERRMPLS